MKGSIDGILRAKDYYVLGHTMMMVNKVLSDSGKLLRYRANTIHVKYVPSEMRVTVRSVWK